MHYSKYQLIFFSYIHYLNISNYTIKENVILSALKKRKICFKQFFLNSLTFIFLDIEKLNPIFRRTTLLSNLSIFNEHYYFPENKKKYLSDSFFI